MDGVLFESDMGVVDTGVELLYFVPVEGAWLVVEGAWLVCFVPVEGAWLLCFETWGVVLTTVGTVDDF